MYEREYITIDPLGDRHVRKVSVWEGGNWHRRSYRDEYYPLGWYRRASYRKDEPELLHGRRG